MAKRTYVTVLLLLAGLLPAAPSAQPLSDEEVWPKGVNGPKKWPPELENSFSTKANGYKYPEGGDPPPVDLFTRIKCPAGTAKAKITRFGSARWETSRWHPPEYAFDDWTMSRWSSWDKNAKHIWADLGNERTVKRVVLVWETAYGKDYDIQVGKDTAAWTTAKEVRGGNGQADVVDLDGKGRYIQMMGVAGGSGYGYSLYEFTICAGDGPSEVTAAAAARAARKSWGLVMGPGGQPRGLQAFDAKGKAAAAGAYSGRFLHE